MKNKGQIRSYSDLQTHIDWQQERCEQLETTFRGKIKESIDEQPLVKTYRLVNGWLSSGIIGVWGSIAHMGLQLLTDVKSGDITKEESLSSYLFKLWNKNKPQ